MGYAPQWSTSETPLRLVFPAGPGRLQAVRRALEGLGLPDGLLQDAKLLATELVSNSILHADLDPGGVIEVTAVRSRNGLRVTVRDEGSASVPDHVVAGSIRPSPSGRSGWGLYLVDKLASRWGTNVGGRVGFWFELEEREARDQDA